MFFWLELFASMQFDIGQSTHNWWSMQIVKVI